MSKPLFDTPEVQFAVDAVRRASALVCTVQRQMVSPAMTKVDHSPVTIGDFSAQAVVARLLDGAFPHDALVGEESAAELRKPDEQSTVEQITGFVRNEFPDATSDDVLAWIDRGAAEPTDRFWTLDPIDGTKGFLRGDQYAVCLALIEDGEVTLGVMGCPNLSTVGEPDMGGPGSIHLAIRGGGTWVGRLTSANFDDMQRVTASAQTQARGARLLRSVESSHTHGGKIEDLVAELGIEAGTVRMDSQAKYAALACGAGEIIVRLLSPGRPDYREKIWDHAAGALAVQEAGGRVTDLDGNPLDFSQGRSLLKNRGVLVTNGYLHDTLLSGLKKVGA